MTTAPDTTRPIPDGREETLAFLMPAARFEGLGVAGLGATHQWDVLEEFPLDGVPHCRERPHYPCPGAAIG